MSQPPPQNNKTKQLLARQPSEHSLEDFIPSFPGTPRDLSIIDVFFKGKKEVQPKKLESVENDATQYQRDTLLKEQDFLIAAEAGDGERLQQLINAGVNVQQTDLFGRNALHLTVYSGNEAAILIALRAGIKATVKDDIGMTPLSICLMRSPKASIAELLFEYGAKILPRVSPMDTGIFIQFVMMCTPTEEEEKIMKLLIENGAMVDDPGAPGQRQALHFAAMSNNCDLIHILANLGANPFALNHRHETPREVALIFKCKEAVECLTQIENDTTTFKAPIEIKYSDEEITTNEPVKEHSTNNLNEHASANKSADISTSENTKVSPSESYKYKNTGGMIESIYSGATLIPKATATLHETAHTNATASTNESAIQIETANSNITANINETRNTKENSNENPNEIARVDSFIETRNIKPAESSTYNETDMIKEYSGITVNKKRTGNQYEAANLNTSTSINEPDNGNETANSNASASTNESSNTIKPANHNETANPHKSDDNVREKHRKTKEHSNDRL